MGHPVNLSCMRTKFFCLRVIKLMFLISKIVCFIAFIFYTNNKTSDFVIKKCSNQYISENCDGSDRNVSNMREDPLTEMFTDNKRNFLTQNICNKSHQTFSRTFAVEERIRHGD